MYQMARTFREMYPTKEEWLEAERLSGLGKAGVDWSYLFQCLMGFLTVILGIRLSVTGYVMGSIVGTSSAVLGTRRRAYG